MSQQTPVTKRPNTEMAFSPEGYMLIDSKALRSILSDLLEEKFKMYMLPIKTELLQAKKDIELLKNDHERTTAKLKKEVSGKCKWKMENAALKQHIEKVESYQRKNNLRITRLKETKGENLEMCITGLFNEFLNPESRFGPKTFERVHRLGYYKKDSDRTIIVRFAHFKDKITALQTRHVFRKNTTFYFLRICLHGLRLPTKFFILCLLPFVP